MAYTVLARRYRSRTFDDLIGQDHVARTLKKAIASGRLAHAYLFCGTRGTGKTSTARILAKCLNCEKSDAPTSEPCGVCNSCQGIARGDDIDVIEIDAASNTGVDNVRDLIENSQYRPARSRFKVYIIDEVHMLSKAAFNALLKTLEEPPEHVKFILATTEPEKVLPTILSRCQRYDFRSISSREIAGHLKEICKAEKIDADDDALALVAKAGAGSMRDALSLLDRLLSVGETKLTTEMIEQLLGLPRSQLLFDLTQSIGLGDVKETLSRADAMIRNGLSPESLVAALVDHLRGLLILATCGRESELVDMPGLSIDELAEQAGRFDPAALTQDIVILEELRRTLRQSSAGRALLDATLARLAMADQFASLGDLLSTLNGGTSVARPAAPRAAAPARPMALASEKKKLDEAPPVVASTPVATIPPAAAAPAPATVASPSTEDEDDDLPRPGKVWEGPSLKELLKQQSQAAPPSRPAEESESNVEPVNPNDLGGVWRTLLKLMTNQSQALAGVLATAKLIGIDEEERAIIRLSPQYATFAKKWEENGKKDVVRDALSQALGRPVGVLFEVGDAPAQTAPPPPGDPPAPPRPRTPMPAADQADPSPPPAPPPARATPEQIEAVRRDVPLVKKLMDELGAQVIRIET